MNNKFAYAVCLAVSAFGALADPTVSDVIVRQQWPWKTAVNVEFVATGFAGAYHQVSLMAYDGDICLGTIPSGAMSGDKLLGTDGIKRITFEPAQVDFLSARKYIGDFKVVPTVSAVNKADILYMIVDLTKSASGPGAVEYITRQALQNGEWGEWTSQVWTTFPDINSPAWLGVTKDRKYLSTHLVLRRVAAATFRMGSTYERNDWGRPGTTEKEIPGPDNEVPHSVTITKDFFIGVFPLTSGQWKQLKGSYRATWESGKFPDEPNFDGFPCPYLSYDQLRGASAGAGWPNADPTVANAVDPDSYVGLLRARTGLGFDLPTEAQWELACRGGTVWAFNNGLVCENLGPGEHYGSNCVELYDEELRPQFDQYRIAWYGKVSGGAPCPVGRLHPNAFGLYDCLGNVFELCLDWYQEDISSFEGNDPVGPSSSSVGKRSMRGGCAWSLWHECRSAARASWEPSATSERCIGTRLVCPAE